MPSISELVEKYREMSAGDLYKISLQIDEYSQEAQAAFRLVVEEHGGKDALLLKIEKQEEVQRETNRVFSQINSLVAQGLHVNEVRSQINTNIIPANHVERLIQRSFQKNELKKRDQQVTPKTLVGGIIGASLGCLLSTCLWAGMLIYTGTIFFIVVPVLAFISYGCIWLFTRQSKENGIVFLLIILSTGVALALGWGIYEVVGYQSTGY